MWFCNFGEMNFAINRNTLLLFFAYFLSGFGNYSHAQKSVQFNHLTTDDGLSQSDVNCIYQDKQGYMWFGTHDGLNKYDGYEFTKYKPALNQQGSISSNLVFDITGDSKGNLWIGTTGGGLNYFNEETETFTVFKHQDTNKYSLKDNHITALFIDKKNKLWIGTKTGLSVLDLNQPLAKAKFQSFDFTQTFDKIEENTINAIYEDSRGQIWVGGTGGLFKSSKNSADKLYFQNINKQINLPQNNIGSIGVDKSGKLLLGTNKGLYTFDKNDKSAKAIYVYAGFYNSMLVVDNEDIWFGTNDGLLHFKDALNPPYLAFVQRFIYEPQNNKSLSKNIVKSLFKDRNGVIWIGTNGGGINKYDPNRKPFQHIRKTASATSLSYDKIRSFYQDSNGTFWVGTEGGGLNYLKSNDSENYSGFKQLDGILKPFAIIETNQWGKKKLLIGAENSPGLYEMDISDPNRIRNDKIRPVEDVRYSVFALLEDHKKTIWIGTYGGGLIRWVPDPVTKNYSKTTFKSGKSNNISLPNNIIRSLFEDGDGNIWIGTADGLAKINAEESLSNSPRFQIYRHDPTNPVSISHNYILPIFESNKGELWIGTLGGGLNKYIPATGDQPAKFIHFDEKDGLPNNVIKGILEGENDNLWLATNRGLSRFNPTAKTFRNYDLNDGLQSNEFQELASYRKENGEILFGGVNGFNAFYPSTIKDNKNAAETVITDLTISNQPVKIGTALNGRTLFDQASDFRENIELNYNENDVSFEFAALHFAAPLKNQFAYMLEGYDNEWIFTTAEKRFATYTNLSPGDYVFKVKASNNDGVWDATPAKISLTIAPPIWLSKLAYLFYGLLFIGLLVLYRRFTINREKRKYEVELEQVEKEKSEELHQLKLEFFTNISHEFRTPLTLIKGPLDYMLNEGDKLTLAQIKDQYKLMGKNTDYLMRLVNQLLDFRKISQGKMRLVVRPTNMVAFIKEIGEPFEFLAEKQQVSFKIIAGQDEIISWCDHDALEKIMNNLLSNAFKFTPENGKVTVLIQQEFGSAESEGNFVSITVKNTGIGIEKDNIKNIFERFYSEKPNSKVNLNGVGIGLTFTKDLVELHQGTIEVDSKKNKKTKFIVRLPADKSVFEHIPEISIKEKSDGDYLTRTTELESFAIDKDDDLTDLQMSKSRSKLPILLVVDDHEDIRNLIKQSLEKEYHILEAENGMEALKIAVKTIPNVILTDVLMPVMNGIELCEKIKTQTETSHIPVIMLTAKTSDESELEGLKNGADGYVRKPFDMDLLKHKLVNILKHRAELRKRFNREVSLQPSEITVTVKDENFLQQAMDVVEKHMMNTDFSVELLVKEMGYSRSNLYLKLKEITGLSSSEFIRNIRLKRAVQLFEQSDLSVKEIMYMTGFNTASYFSKCFKKQFGVIPSEYIKQKGESIGSDER